MKSFKDYLVEFDTPQIYCDMDGVLVDFVKYTSEHLGQPFTDEKWTELPTDMFYRMPPMTDAKVLWNFIGKYDPFILTAVPRKSTERGPVSERAADDKKRWMKKHFRVNDAKIYAANPEAGFMILLADDVQPLVPIGQDRDINMPDAP